MNPAFQVSVPPRILSFCFLLVLISLPVGLVADEPAFLVGFGKHDITPTEPVRLSGYAVRTKPFASVADPLSARAMVFQTATKAQSTSAPVRVLVTIDAIAATPEITNRIASFLDKEYSIPRQDFVIAASHAHTAPHLSDGLVNLYSTPLRDDEVAAIDRYTQYVIDGITQAIETAMANRRPASLQLAVGEATFAKNRRGIRGAVRPGLTEKELAPVDHRVRVLQASDAEGKLLGLAYLYACHCTSISPDINQVSSDWAGLSASRLEQLHPGIVALPVIGCGADSNPDPRGTYELAQKHALELVSSIEAVVSKPMQRIAQAPETYFGYAGLAPEIPSRKEIEEALQASDYNRRRWAEIMKETWERMGRLPESYPAPLHVWRFGDQLDWVFMGGEVVLDYQLRAERELPAKQVWVAAYCDDVFAYVASERVRGEGGYEVDSSMIYYARPGRWQSGSEDLIFKRLAEITAKLPSEDRAMSAEASHAAIGVPVGYHVDLLAAEPMTADPVNIAFGPDGRVWVVEMADYPLGNETGGRVRWMRDTDGDGKLDQSVVFLDKLSFPTGVAPWRDGVIVLQAPEMFLARDTDGDGVADERIPLIKGFAESNPQHRLSGFEWGLDGWLYFGSGMSTTELEVIASGQKVVVNSSDVRWNPVTGQLQRLMGETQFVRSRDEFGNWFGNSNSLPMYQFVIDERYMQREHLPQEPIQHLIMPAVAPPVFPRSRTVDRFNDLFARNRFTSACSSIVCRVDGLGESMRGAAVICEPVHNLVARYQVRPENATYAANRFEEDSQFDFVASSDPWFRPVRVVNAPDSTIWIVDMQRRVIEHPEWIPEAWQKQFDLRAGSDFGRIYRVRQADFQPDRLADLTLASNDGLLDAMRSSNGALRDLAMQVIHERSLSKPESVDGLEAELVAIAKSSNNAAVRLQAFHAAAMLSDEKPAVWANAIDDSDWRVVRAGIEAVEEFEQDFVLKRFIQRVLADDGATDEVYLQAALSCGLRFDEAFVPAMQQIAARKSHHLHIANALTLADPGYADATLQGMLQLVSSNLQESAKLRALTVCVQRLVSHLNDSTRVAYRQRIIDDLQKSQSHLSQSDLLLLIGLVSNLTGDEAEWIARVQPMVADRLLARDESLDTRLQLVGLLGTRLFGAEQAISVWSGLLESGQPPEIRQAAIDAAFRIDSDAVADRFIEAWPSLFSDERSRVSATLMQRDRWLEQMVQAIESGKIKARELDAATTQQLKTHPDAELRKRLEQALGTVSNVKRKELAEKMLNGFPSSGVVDRGAVLFKEHCSVCHLGKEESAALGPSLSGLGHWTNAQWINAVIDPNQAVEPRYLQYRILTKTGQAFVGVVERRTSGSIQIAASDGRRMEIENEDIETIQASELSLMPEGFEDKLKAQHLADIIAYLKQL